MSPLASKTTAFEASAVPRVIPSRSSNSASVMTALPIVKPVALNTPVTVAPTDEVAIFALLS